MNKNVYFDHPKFKPVVQHREAQKLTIDMYERCRSLCSRKDKGLMSDWLKKAWHENVPAEVFYIDKPNQSWASYDPYRLRAWALLSDLDRTGIQTLQLYVRKTERGKNLGDMLMQAALPHTFMPKVFVNEQNAGFFEKYQNAVTILPGDLKWMERLEATTN